MSDLIKNIRPMLCPPGHGVFTVNTAKERKEQLGKRLFNQTSTEAVTKAWEDTLSTLTTGKTQWALLGVCSDCGGGIQRGANWGPLFIRENLYETSKWSQDSRFLDLGDIRVIPHLLHDKYLNEETITSCRKALYSEFNEPELLKKLPVSPLSLSEKVLDETYKALPKLKILTLGGDHSVSYPVVKSFLRAKKEAGIKVGLIHFDAHTDLLHSRLGIDLCFGSWVTHILDDLPSPEACIQLGIRSSGKERGFWENQFGIKQIWNTEFNEKNPIEMAKECANILVKQGIEEIYVSFDIDALDETVASATGTPEPDGLKLDDCLAFIHQIKEELPITGCDLMEVAPFLSMPTKEAKLNPEPYATLMAATSLIQAMVALD